MPQRFRNCRCTYTETASCEVSGLRESLNMARDLGSWGCWDRSRTYALSPSASSLVLRSTEFEYRTVYSRIPNHFSVLFFSSIDEWEVKAEYTGQCLLRNYIGSVDDVVEYNSCSGWFWRLVLPFLQAFQPFCKLPAKRGHVHGFLPGNLTHDVSVDLRADPRVDQTDLSSFLPWMTVHCIFTCMWTWRKWFKWPDWECDAPFDWEFKQNRPLRLRRIEKNRHWCWDRY